MPTSTKKTDGGRIPGGVVIPNALEVVWFWQLPNLRTGHTVTHARNRGTFVASDATAEAIRASIATNLSTNLSVWQHVSTIFQRLTVRDMSALTNPAFMSANTPTPGTGVGAPQPSQLAAVLTGFTAIRGKGTRARYYMPGFIIGTTDVEGHIISGLQTALNAFGSALPGNYTANGLDLALARPARQQYTGITGTVHPQRGPTIEPVTSVRLNDVIFDTVRSRVKP